MDFQPQSKLPDLLAEPLSDAEVRTLLERLGSQEFGSSENATIGAVIEATGSDPVTVGRLLAEIRKEDFEERFGLQLKDHGRRIDTLENKAQRIERNAAIKETRSPTDIEWDRYRQRELDRVAKEEADREAMLPPFLIFLGAIVFATLLVLGSQCQTPTPGPLP